MTRTRKKPAPPPAAPKRRRGRPSYVPTPEIAMRVSELLSCGMSQDDICLVIRIDRNTLAKHYPDTIRAGAAERRAEVVDLIWSNARKGNMTAIKHLEGMTSVAAAESTFSAAADKAEAPRRLGKKEQAERDALQAGDGSEWAGDLGPVPAEKAETAH